MPVVDRRLNVDILCN